MIEQYVPYSLGDENQEESDHSSDDEQRSSEEERKRESANLHSDSDKEAASYQSSSSSFVEVYSARRSEMSSDSDKYIRYAPQLKDAQSVRD